VKVLVAEDKPAMSDRLTRALRRDARVVVIAFFGGRRRNRKQSSASDPRRLNRISQMNELEEVKPQGVNRRQFLVNHVVKTPLGARTMALDPATRTIYMATTENSGKSLMRRFSDIRLAAVWREAYMSIHIGIRTVETLAL